MSNAEKTLVSVATYNEIENLPLLAGEVFQHAPQVDLLVIDDNSPDGTGRWCDEQAQHDPRLHCLHRAGKLGLGSAIVAAMRYSIEHGYKYLLNIDADFSHHPRGRARHRRCGDGSGGGSRRGHHSRAVKGTGLDVILCSSRWHSNARALRRQES